MHRLKNEILSTKCICTEMKSNLFTHQTVHFQLFHKTKQHQEKNDKLQFWSKHKKQLFPGVHCPKKQHWHEIHLTC